MLRDREASIPKVFDHLHAEAREKGLTNFHIWTRYSIENYLLEPEFVVGAINQEASDRRKPAPDEQTILNALTESCDRVFDSARAAFISAAEAAYQRYSLVLVNQREAAIKDALAYLDGCRDLVDKINVLPGYKIFSQFVQTLQNRFGLSIRFESLIERIDRQNAPAELLSFFDKLEALSAQRESSRSVS